jgi:hypothetical protein
MYFSRQPVPERGVRELRSLRFSLNTPVVSIESLAVGPARAAIAIQDLADGRTTVQLVLRSQRTAQLACFSHDEPHESDASTQVALDGALSFAESMGFLFDEDAIPDLGADGPREAADAWNDLLGLSWSEPPAPTPLSATSPLASGAEEDDALETDDDMDGDHELEVDPEPDAAEAPAELWLEELAPVAAAAVAAPSPGASAAPSAHPIAKPDPEPAPPAPLLLTKFRRNAGEGQGARRNGWPIRLLSHF